MCGIVGALNSGPRFSNDTNALNLKIQSMLGIMSHRGPDHSDTYIDENVALGHCRLSIIDTIERSNQPMIDESGRFVLIFNGELYNYKELRDVLRGLGYRFKTKSDTEVMLYSLIEWKGQALEKFIGMFAGCFYDSVSKATFLFRDPFGQKPLYFSYNDDGDFAFSSEIKPLLIYFEDVQPNWCSWQRYVSFASYDNNAETMFENVSQLLPGECLSIDNQGRLQKRRWYDLRSRVSPTRMSYDQAGEELLVLLCNSLKLHMRSDVPVGVCLSGGLDSSVLAAVIDQTKYSSENLNCLSVEFDNEFSEEQWIKSAAEQCGFSYEILNFSSDDFLSSIKPMMWHQEAPIGGLMHCAMSKVFERSKELGIRVMQDGTGLDEAFGGYQHHHNIFIENLSSENSDQFERALLDYCRNWRISPENARAAIKRSIDQPKASIDGTVPYRHDLLDFDVCEVEKLNEVECHRGSSEVLDSLIRYFQSEKIPRNTRMKDKLSMAYSVELRLPFLDHRLVEFGLSLPTELMFKNGYSKSVLRHSVHNILSDDVRLARKRSIQAPQGKWLADANFHDYVNDIISSQSFKNLGLFNVHKCQAAFKEHQSIQAPNSSFIWQWINIYEWFDVFKKHDAVSRQFKLS